jgi:hypothetical protein
MHVRWFEQGDPTFVVSSLSPLYYALSVEPYEVLINFTISPMKLDKMSNGGISSSINGMEDHSSMNVNGRMQGSWNCIRMHVTVKRQSWVDMVHVMVTSGSKVTGLLNN